MLIVIDSLGCLFPKVNTLNLKPNFILFFSPLPLGIANALDLTDRILPRLQAQPGCRPQLLNFPPYSREELAAIVQDRLTQVRIGEQRRKHPDISCSVECHGECLLSGCCPGDPGGLGRSVLCQEGVGRVRRRPQSSGHLQVRGFNWTAENSVQVKFSHVSALVMLCCCDVTVK